MRRRLWQIHSWLGLVAGLGLCLIGLTGNLLVFHDELEGLFNRESVCVEPTPGGRQSLDTLRRQAEQQLAGYELTGWLIQDDPRRADILYVMKHGEHEWLVATLDPYSGRLLANPRMPTATLTGWLLELHYAFFADHLGLLAAGVLAVLLLVLGLSGIWLYRAFWRHLLTLRWGRGLRILFSDVHKFVGITTAAFNFVLGFTGAYWNFTHVIAEGWGAQESTPKSERRLYADTLSLDALLADSTARLPGFRANYLSLPYDSRSTPAVVVLWGAQEGHPFFESDYGSTVTYDANTGQHLATNDLRGAGFWVRVLDAFRPLHFGNFGGLPVKVLWCLGGLSPGVLAVSGFTIWRLRTRRTSRRQIF